MLREGIGRLHDSGSETARLDAELLLGDAAGLARSTLLAHPEAPIEANDAARYRAGIERRAHGEPVAYIRGIKEFYGLTFAVDRRALIPRPETERLVELGEAEVRRHRPVHEASDGGRLRIVDVGTGSGAVIVALAVSLRRHGLLDRVELLALDVSLDALALARENADKHAIADAIRLERADVLERDAAAGVDRQHDLVLANLPYVRHDVIPDLPIAASFEPALALDGGADGLAVIERLLSQLPVALAPGGLALLEIGADQGRLVIERCERLLPGWHCIVEPDLSGLPRVARISRT